MFRPERENLRAVGGETRLAIASTGRSEYSRRPRPLVFPHGTEPMRSTTASLFLVLISVVLCGGIRPSAGAQDARGPAKLCGKCKSKGKLVNPFLDEKWLALEADCLHCSERVERDRAGVGLPEIPCRGCVSVEVAKPFLAEFEKQAAVETEWLKERRKIDAKLKPRKPFVHVETRHFQITWGIDKVVLPDKTTLDAHAAAHLYAKRMEEFYVWFQKLLNTNDQEARNTKHQLYLMGDERTLIQAALEYAAINTDRAGRAVGDPSILTTWWNRSTFKTDASFHQHVVHHVAHLLLGVFHLKVWLAEDTGWLEEGIAHLAEMELFDRSGNSCNTEGTEEDMADDDWQPVTRKLAATGKPAPFAQWMNKKAHMLGAEEHYLAWSYTDFLYRRKPEALREMVKKLKEKVPQRDLLRDLYQLTTTGIDEEWRAYVLENYRTKPLPGR